MIRRFLSSQSVGRPQFIAAGLLFVYLLECVWLIHIQTRHGLLPDTDHALRMYYGLAEWNGNAVAGTPDALRAEAATGIASSGRNGHLVVQEGYDRERSPLYYLIAGAPALVAPPTLPGDSTLAQIWFATPYLLFGVMLGGSLWYVARRLFGNAGGYISLALFCFSPAMIVGAAAAQNLGEMGAVWGAFGAIFTAIAVAHTLYAPREVVLWNWRRILLLGLSLVLVVGNQFSLMIIVGVALLLMLWVAPIRKRAAVAIWATAAAFAFVLLYASYAGDARLFAGSLRHALWLDVQPQALLKSIAYTHTFAEIFAGSPPLQLLLPGTLITYFAWKRTRYFGNTAPLVVALLLFLMAAGAPLFPGQGFHLAALTFLFVFVSGVSADLMETNQSSLVAAVIAGLLTAAALWNTLQLVRLARS